MPYHYPHFTYEKIEVKREEVKTTTTTKQSETDRLTEKERKSNLTQITQLGNGGAGSYAYVFLRH